MLPVDPHHVKVHWCHQPRRWNRAQAKVETQQRGNLTLVSIPEGLTSTVRLEKRRGSIGSHALAIESIFRHACVRRGMSCGISRDRTGCSVGLKSKSSLAEGAGSFYALLRMDPHAYWYFALPLPQAEMMTWQSKGKTWHEPADVMGRWQRMRFRSNQNAQTNVSASKLLAKQHKAPLSTDSASTNQRRR